MDCQGINQYELDAEGSGREGTDMKDSVEGGAS